VSRAARLAGALGAFAFLAAMAPAAEAPALLMEAFKNWGQGKEDLSFVQRTRFLNDDGSVKEERLERYDPSLPDNERWALLAVDGKPPSDKQRETIQDRRNKKPRKKAIKSLEEYFDLKNANLVKTETNVVFYEVAVRPETARLINMENLKVGISVRKDAKTIERLTADLSKPMRIALGVAKVTDLDLDLRFDAEDDHNEKKGAESSSGEADGTAKVVMTKLGNRAEYSWSEFKRVSRFKGEAKPGS
jgi:hypothetical protein